MQSPSWSALHGQERLSRWRSVQAISGSSTWPGCPTRSVLTGAVAWNLVALGEARARGERTGQSISIEGSLLVNTSHVWAAYWESKTIYTIEPAVVGQFEMRGLLLPLFSWTARDR